LIVKASAGGGGKGMKVVESSAQIVAAVESAQRIARTSFGDARLLLERYFVAARHVEVQIFADAHGNAVALFDRDCSVQRRHQKVVEEAPAPGLRAEVRAAMAEAALTVARAVGYSGAGTVEFLLDPQQNFYFMEMNTRLQVEHPVTELIAGIDLVEWQLRVASGQRMDEFATTPRSHGAAVEVRLYAEDPARDYLPSVGTIAHLRWPAAQPGLRLDVGVDAGDRVSPFYDPMLGKLIAWAETREQAIDKLAAAVSQLELTGVAINRRLLISILRDQEFRAGRLSTNFLLRRAECLDLEEQNPADADYMAAALWHAQAGAGNESSPWAETDGWWLGGAARSRWTFSGTDVEVTQIGAAEFAIQCAERAYEVRLNARSADSVRFEFEARMRTARLLATAGELHVFCEGRHSIFVLARTEDSMQSSDTAAQGSLTTPLPGTVVAVLVKAGQAVSAGDALITVEAMKMEHTLKSPRDGQVRRVPFNLGERVLEGAVLIELEDPKGA
jgi:3-methylcrotonyl-CoA carboxylase alpha subunit